MHIIIHHNGAYNLYSTIADGALYESALTLDQLYEVVRIEQGETGLRDLLQRLARAQGTGSSSRMHHGLASLVAANRSGDDGKRLTLEEFLAKYLTFPTGAEATQKTTADAASKPRYRLVECPGFTAIEDSLDGEYLVTIATKRREGSFYSTEEMSVRKARVLAIFNASCTDKELTDNVMLDLAHAAGLNPLRDSNTCGVSALKRLLVLYREHRGVTNNTC